MPIITFQNQECKASNPISMTKARLSKDLFTNIFENTLTSRAYINLVNTLKNNLRGSSSETYYVRVKDVILDTFNGKYNPKYSTYMSQLSKLGMICTYKGHIHINPIVKTKVTNKLHETVLEYYRLMWSDAFLTSVYIKFNDEFINLSSSTDLKQVVVEDKKFVLQFDKELSHLTSQEIYDIGFTHSKNVLRNEDFYSNLGLQSSASLIRLKSSIGTIYKNLGFQVTQQLGVAHLELLTEQLPLVDNQDTHYIFARLPKKWKCIHFNQTSTYTQAIDLFNLNNNPPITSNQQEEPTMPQQQATPFVVDEAISAKTLSNDYLTINNIVNRTTPREVPQVEAQSPNDGDYPTSQQRFVSDLKEWETLDPDEQAWREQHSPDYVAKIKSIIKRRLDIKHTQYAQEAQQIEEQHNNKVAGLSNFSYHEYTTLPLYKQMLHPNYLEYAPRLEQETLQRSILRSSSF